MRPSRSSGWTQARGRLGRALVACLIVAPLALAALGLGAALTACGGGAAAESPSGLVGETFPSVTGESLDGAAVSLPGDYAGAPAIVLVAPSKDSQDDADKWIAALRPKKHVVFVETPILGSLITRMMQGFINGKMRGGEPKDMWPRIVPMYKDGDELKELFGDHGTLRTYVTVIDGDGVIRTFLTSGFSDEALADALAAYEELK